MAREPRTGRDPGLQIGHEFVEESFAVNSLATIQGLEASANMFSDLVPADRFRPILGFEQLFGVRRSVAIHGTILDLRHWLWQGLEP